MATTTLPGQFENPWVRFSLPGQRRRRVSIAGRLFKIEDFNKPLSLACKAYSKFYCVKPRRDTCFFCSYYVKTTM